MSSLQVTGARKTCIANNSPPQRRSTKLISLPLIAPGTPQNNAAFVAAKRACIKAATVYATPQTLTRSVCSPMPISTAVPADGKVLVEKIKACIASNATTAIVKPTPPKYFQPSTRQQPTSASGLLAQRKLDLEAVGPVQKGIIINLTKPTPATEAPSNHTDYLLTTMGGGQRVGTLDNIGRISNAPSTQQQRLQTAATTDTRFAEYFPPAPPVIPCRVNAPNPGEPIARMRPCIPGVRF